MNWILLDDADLEGDGRRARLAGRRWRHVRDVHRARPGDWLRVGRLGGRLGRGRVLRIDDREVELEIELDRDPPPKLPIELILALPRPRVLRRLLPAIASLGVGRLVLVNAWRVEKSFWASEAVEPDRLRASLRLGLEMAGDTRLPEVRCERFFRPYVEERLAAAPAKEVRLVAHPGAGRPCPRALSRPVSLAVGPEGGFIQPELDSFTKAGFEAVHLGDPIGRRVLDVTTAVTALVSRLS